MVKPVLTVILPRRPETLVNDWTGRDAGIFHVTSINLFALIFNWDFGFGCLSIIGYKYMDYKL